MTDLFLLASSIGGMFAAVEYVAADAPDLNGWPQFGLVGVVLAMVFWLLKQFFENTMKQQTELVATMVSIRDSSIKTAELVMHLDERISEHMKNNEKIDVEILGAIKRCGDATPPKAP